MLMPITLTFAAAATLLNIWLGVRISRLRASHHVLHGDGGHGILLRRMRAQSNYVEYTPFALILCGLIEVALGSATWLWITALLYIIGRVFHAFGMDSDTPHRLRIVGIFMTIAILLVLSGTALYAAYSSMRTMPAPPALAAL